jgi:thioredoxin-related protein
MSIWATRLKRISLAAALFVGVLLCVKVIRRVFFPKTSAGVSRAVARPGKTISLSDVDWAQSEKTLLLVLDKGCIYCRESVPFYRKLIAKNSAEGGPRMIAVLPQPDEESRKFLDEMSITIKDVKHATAASLGLAGTPSLVLVNNKGVIVGVWTGKLPQETEAKLLAQL